MSSENKESSAVDLQKKNVDETDQRQSEVRKTKHSGDDGDEGSAKKARKTDEESVGKDDECKGHEKRFKGKTEAHGECSSNTPSDLSTSSIRADRDVVAAEGNTDHTSLVANHYNVLEEKGLSQRNQSRIVYMRNFNNWIKSMLINEYMQKVKQSSRGIPLKVLDMCCGKGGDLLKWKKSNIRHLICADIAEVSIEQCQTRYKDLSNKDRRGFEPVFTAEFLVADCTKVRLREKFKDASIQLDLVSCQFAFHYSFESLPQAECMLKNAGETLKMGGYFIGTIPNAYDLVSRWQKCEGNKFGNDVYNVEFQCDNKEKPPLFGGKYNFHLEGVVDCPEFLVYLPVLRKLALKFGLKLVMFERFEDYYEKMKDEGRSLLGKMQGLEPYPPSHEAPLVGKNPSDYQHAIQYMQTSTGHRKIGTLSQSEWEATSMYAVFAFQKMKTKLNEKGEPEYEDL